MPGHVPVLLDEVLAGLKVEKGGTWIDATLGAGGHSLALLERAGPTAVLLGLDRDRDALRLALERLETAPGDKRLGQGSFSNLGVLAKAAGLTRESVDGIMMDLGVSSMQLDRADRGFSIKADGPLDMRMDPEQGESAAEWLNRADERDIEEVLRDYGEEKRARAIARAIVRARPLQRTSQLSSAICSVVGGPRPGKVHPATRAFQAVRIKVNGELEALTAALEQVLDLLKPGGRLAVISFHSLEDRIVKRWIDRESKDCLCPPEILRCVCGHKACVKKVGRKAVKASQVEMDKNPRARSARLRIAEKIGG